MVIDKKFKGLVKEVHAGIGITSKYFGKPPKVIQGGEGMGWENNRITSL